MAQAQVVQATCPGCKTVLRIPGDWLRKPIRCKNCGTVMQAREPAKVAPNPPSPPRLPTKAPIAPPKTMPASTAGFDFDDEGTGYDSPPPSRRRKKKSGAWVGLAILGGLALSLGVLAFVFQDRLRAGFQAAVTRQLPDDDESGLGSATGTPKPIKGAFPRRAMIISVHNYLYANPINDAPEIKNVETPPNIARLMNSLNRGLNIPLNQIVHLSDNAKKSPMPPLRTVIEEGLVNFLKTCRKQDRIMVYFIGHTKEVNDQAYLVPLEGEFDNVETLIPLKWVYDQLAKCEAQQKILVIDGNRFNAAQGEERPSAGPLGEKF